MAMFPAMSTPAMPPDAGLPEALDVVLDDENATTTETSDGGMVVDFGEKAPAADIPFAGDLTELFKGGELTSLGHEIVDTANDDDAGRAEWKKTYTKGLKLLGLNIEERTEPWEGASGAFHPLLLESIIRFNAQAMTDLFPGAGPVKTKTIGRVDTKTERQSKRVRRDLNYMATDVIVGFREETDMMLMNLPLAGTTFRSWGFDAVHMRPEAAYIQPQDVIIPYAASSLHTAERYTVVLHKTKNWIKSKQEQGFYRDVEVGAGTVTKDEIGKAKEKITGQTLGSAQTRDWMHDIYECHIMRYLPQDPLNPDQRQLPYVISVDKQSSKVLSIRREWREGDQTMERVENVVQHKYMPGFGPYGLGLVNILGGLTDSATSIMRMLVDAGVLSNLPAGYKTKGMRIKNDSDPHGPGEWRDVEVTAGTLRDNFFPLPYKEPSTVLAALLGQIVEEGRRIGSVADMKITDMTGQNMPVGTTLAIIERSMKVMNAVQLRLYESFGKELKVLQDIVQSYMLDLPYPFELDEAEKDASRKTDYTPIVDVIPVADPNATTMAQRIMGLQAVMQLTQTAPQIYDLKEVHRDMVGVLGFEEQAERYIPRPQDVLPRDPVTENMDLINLKPVKAGLTQNHDAHLAVHMAAVNDPKMQASLKDNPAAGAIVQAAAAHIQEHLAFQYRQQLEETLGVPLPPPNEPLPDDVEYELSGVIAEAAAKLLGKHKAEQKAIEVLAAMEDPVIQNEQRALDIKEKEANARVKIEADKVEIDKKRLTTEVMFKIEAQRTEVSVRQAEIAGRHAETILKGNIHMHELETAQRTERAAAEAKLEQIRLAAANDRMTAERRAELAREVAMAEQAIKDREAAHNRALAGMKAAADASLRDMDMQIKTVDREIKEMELQAKAAAAVATEVKAAADVTAAMLGAKIANAEAATANIQVAGIPALDEVLEGLTALSEQNKKLAELISAPRETVIERDAQNRATKSTTSIKTLKGIEAFKDRYNK